MNARLITREDVLSLAEYAKVRDSRRREMSLLKQNRRVGVGPDVTFYFECFATMLQQVQEMLYIEKGGDEQLEDELRAYNPLIPNGSELVATMMIEIEEAGRRARVLAQLGGIEETVSITVGGETIRAVPEADQERTTPDGKTSSVHFLKFPFTPTAIAAFRAPGARAVLGIGHSNYDHMAALPEPVRAALAADFD
jgi:Protein of unknown function (DUF3501).